MSHANVPVESRYSETDLPSLSKLWAKKYISKLKEQDSRLGDLSAAQLRIDMARALMDLLRPVSAQAWHKTEALLAHEIRRHNIDSDLIDPWAISRDVHQIYEKSLSAFANHVTPQQLSVAIAEDIGVLRRKHTAIDPRVIGFVSLQFHYCGQMLAAEVMGPAQAILKAYFKVVDDHLYMPLQRAYQAAANYQPSDPRLATVHHLLPYTSKIAIKIVEEVHRCYPDYRTFSGPINTPAIKVSSIRDVEMFQIYILTCVLEQNISAIQQELFPLCVMLYPTLKVRWELVREMLTLLQDYFAKYSDVQDAVYYRPYQDALWRMFSTEVLG
ncbi:MAG: hypothetical protein AAFX01_06310 [Cyanobacteria bacterium J06638_28]